jgi:hypothetical protein
VLCVFAATIFWFFNALNKTYTTNINFPLRFDYDHASFVPVKSLPEQVRMNVTGNGWDLFKRSTGVKVGSLEIPLERPSDVKKIVGGTLPIIFSNQIDGLEINFVLTDTLYLDLEPKSGKWIKLAMDSIELNLRKGFGLSSEISIAPDSVFIEGPQRLINAFEEPVKLRLQQRNIDEPFTEDVEIVIPSSNVIKRDPPTVSVKFDVERLVNIQDSVLIAVENVPPTVAFIEERYIPVTVAVPQNMVDNFNMDSARAILNLKNFTRGKAIIKPRIAGLPPYTQLIKLDSVRITL